MTMNLVADLHGAVDRGEIVAVYQPQVDSETLEVVAVEALARWMHPDYGLVVPGIFIPLAEAHDLIGEIGDFMVDEGARRAAEWDALGLDLEVAINVSAAQLHTLDFLDRLQRNLDDLSLVPAKIVIEVTESLPVTRVAKVIERLAELRELGMGVSVDDFGTGYSSLAQLAGIPATELKIDKSLIQDPDASMLLMRAVVESAHQQGLRVVAEGIETQEHLAVARALDCDRLQGYLFGRPAPAEEITSTLARAVPRLS